jgi:hypothetical protein
VREAVAADIIWVAWEDTNTNLADLLTKTLPRVKRETLMDYFMFDCLRLDLVKDDRVVPPQTSRETWLYTRCQEGKFFIKLSETDTTMRWNG